MLSFYTFFCFLIFFANIAGNVQAENHSISRVHMVSKISRSKERIRKSLITVRNATSADGKAFKLVDFYQGNSFLSEWDFFTGTDPTRGSIAYQSKQAATAKGLAFVQPDGTTVLAVDDKTYLPPGTPRDSVRISTKRTYNGGLFVADIFAMPHGCSVWPAYWSVGPNWPHGGEVDILEGTQDQPTNQYTLHTSEGCTLSTDNIRVVSNVLGKQCASRPNNNAGCGFLDTDSRTYGHGFNLIAGGVYAHLWDNSGIKIWHFPRSSIPSDIVARNPNPTSWGRPAAFFSSSSCDMGKHFFDHSLVLDIALCGDFASATFNKLGCVGECADMVGNPGNYNSAKWKLNYIAVYQ